MGAMPITSNKERAIAEEDLEPFKVNVIVNPSFVCNTKREKGERKQ
jgi:hypothetical protein